MSKTDQPTEKINGNGGFWRLVMACAVALVATTGCFGNGQVAPNSKPSRESDAALPDARAGNPAALHRSFHAAYAQVMRPYPNQGDSAHDLAANLDSILVALGDKEFAAALLRERPLVQSAVRDCMVEGNIEQSFPLTYEVFQKAPQNEWPSDMPKDHDAGPESQPAPPSVDGFQ